MEQPAKVNRLAAIAANETNVLGVIGVFWITPYMDSKPMAEVTLKSFDTPVSLLAEKLLNQLITTRFKMGGYIS